VILLYQQLYWRSWRRVRGVHAYRSVFTASTVILSAYAAAAICAAFGFVPTDLFQWTRWGSAGVILLAILAYTVVNAVLVALAITLSERRLDLRRSLGTTRENALEFGTLGLGALSVVPITLNLALATLLIPALLVLHRSVLMRQLEEAAFTDPHTGLTNATTWTSVATLELERAAREGRTLGILMIDIDYFKKVNDTHGHLVGDQVLRAIADTLSRSVSRHDLVARWGGEEFVMLCPDLSATELGQLGDRLCQRIRQLQVPVSLPGHLDTIEGLTVSIGAASFPDFGPDLQDILLAADDALFGAKDNGRDQIHCVTPARFPDSPRDIS
jgi:diguanylate cyclase (GGDEF)-like protein